MYLSSALLDLWSLKLQINYKKVNDVYTMGQHILSWRTVNTRLTTSLSGLQLNGSPLRDSHSATLGCSLPLVALRLSIDLVLGREELIMVYARNHAGTSIGSRLG